MIYSDDASARRGNPVDALACLAANPTHWPQPTASPMEPVARSGNRGAIGFTKDNNPVWNGTNSFYYNWVSSIGYADLTTQSVVPAAGFPMNFIYVGLQVSRIVTTSNGKMFLHSGTNASLRSELPAAAHSRSQYSLGIYISDDGINWTQFNTGITGNERRIVGRRPRRGWQSRFYRDDRWQGVVLRHERYFIRGRVRWITIIAPGPT